MRPLDNSSDQSANCWEIWIYVHLYMYIVYNMYVYVIAHMQKSIHLKTAQVGSFFHRKTIQGHSKSLGLMGRDRVYSIRNYFMFWSPQNQVNKACNIMGPSFRWLFIWSQKYLYIWIINSWFANGIGISWFWMTPPHQDFWELGVASLAIQIKGLIHKWTGFPIETITHIHISTYFHQACNNWFKNHSTVLINSSIFSRCRRIPQP